MGTSVTVKPGSVVVLAQEPDELVAESGAIVIVNGHNKYGDKLYNADQVIKLIEAAREALANTYTQPPTEHPDDLQ